MPAALVWHDQPDYYTTATLPRFWSVAHADAEVAAGAGYDGDAALTGATEDAYVVHFPVDLDDVAYFGLGCRVQVDTLPAAEKILLAVVDADADIQVCVTLGTDGRLSIWNGDQTTLLTTSGDAIDTGVPFALGFRGLISRTSGWAEVYVDGDVFVRVSDVDTAPVLTGWYGIYVGLAPDIFHSHLYAQQGDGALRPGYLVRVVFPTAATLTSDWEPLAGTVPAAIDEADADDDTSYIFAEAEGDQFAVSFTTVPDTTIIHATRSVAVVQNVDATGSPSLVSPSYAPLVRSSGGARDVGQWRSVTQEDWTAIDRFDVVNPHTGLPWTPATINASGWGGETQV